MASFVNVCRFRPTAGGTTDWTVSAAITGYQTPATAGAVDAAIYKYRAESSDLSQWEVGYGAYTVSSTLLARTTVLSNSLGTTAKISFTGAPQVAIVALAEDLDPLDGAVFGLTLSTAGASTTFTTAIGWAADSTAVNIMRRYASLAKTTSAWAVGAATGSLDTGSIANSTWYHVFIIKRLDTGVTDILTSLSATTPTMPTNYTLKRRIGSMKTNGSAQWTAFSQEGDEFLWVVGVGDLAGNITASPASYTLTVPTGVKVQALFTIQSTAAVDSYLSVSSPDAALAAVNTPAGRIDLYVNVGGKTSMSGQLRIRTNTSAQISIVGSAIFSVNIATHGWVDTRGRYA